VRYDLAFKHWGEFYFPGEDWHWWRAQGVAESGLNPGAVSPDGARGIMQLMPETAREMGADPSDAESNIRGGIKFDRELWNGWSRCASTLARRDLMFASYNAGPGNIEQAVRLAGSSLWEKVAPVLRRVTGTHAVETIHYVQRIDGLMKGAN
jgi:membrane-bound lytic murein transglycosylase F